MYRTEVTFGDAITGNNCRTMTIVTRDDPFLSPPGAPRIVFIPRFQRRMDRLAEIFAGRGQKIVEFACYPPAKT
jgi:hypothetical protein